MARTVLLLGTLDTKGEEYAYLRERLRARAASTSLLADVGTLEPPRGWSPTSRARRSARETGADVGRAGGGARPRRGDRRDGGGRRGARAAPVRRGPHPRRARGGRLGQHGDRHARPCRRCRSACPSSWSRPMAAGDTRDYIGGADVMLMASVTDVAGHQLDLAPRILANAAAAMAGHGARRRRRSAGEERPLIGRHDVRRDHAVRHARARGAGGARLRGARLPRHRHRRAGRWRRWSRRGFLRGRARRDHDRAVRRPRRRRAVGRAGPAGGGGRARAPAGGLRSARWTWSTSAPATPCPPQFADRNLYVHNPSVTLMRTTAEECAELGRRIARKLSAATGPVALFLPLRGVSMIDAEGQPFHDPRGRRGAVRRAARGRRRLAGRAGRARPATSTTRSSPPPMADKLDALPRKARAMTGDEARAKLRATLDGGGVIIGAGAGTGLSAKCAEAGGTDLIIIYNSGRYRMAGRGSLAGLMPYGDANAIVMDMAPRGAADRARHAGARRRLRHRPVPADAAASCARCATPASPACRTSRPSA